MRVLQNITPTPEQIVILGDDRPGYRLIRGAAGSGKTSVALMRLRQLCASRARRNSRLGIHEPVQVLVLTFNQTLRGYVKHLAIQQITSDTINLSVETFSRWAVSLCESGQNIALNHRQLIRNSLEKYGITEDLEYFTDEVEYILGRFPKDNRILYLQATRDGRGRSPQVPQTIRSRLLDHVIPDYERTKKTSHLTDWNDVALFAADKPSAGYDIVVVDEAQDLSANQIRAIKAHLRPNHATTFIMDSVQRIYPQAFRWREIEIEIRPQMVYTLGQNHRNTAAIARFAAAIVRGMPEEENGVIPNPDSCPEEGQKPKVIAGYYRNQMVYMFKLIHLCLETNETVAILKIRGGNWFKYVRERLDEQHIDYSEITRVSDWPTGPEQVALSTIHSAKGLEFDHVLLPGLNQKVTPHGSEEGDGTMESLRRLLAVGIGRARKTVTVGYKPGEESRLIEFFDSETYDFVELD